MKTGAANELLSSALAALDTQPDVSVRSFSLRDADDRAAMVGHLIPIRRSAHDIFAGSYALLVPTPGPPGELMRSLFDPNRYPLRSKTLSRSRWQCTPVSDRVRANKKEIA